MEITMNKKNTIELVKQYIVNLVALLVFWGGLIRTNYNADTLNHMFSEDADVMVRLEDGRFMNALFDYLLFKAGVRTSDNIRICVMCGLIVLAFTMLMLQYIFKKWEPSTPLTKMAYRLALGFVFLNVLFEETIFFPEVITYYAISYLLSTVAVFIYTKGKVFWAIVCWIFAASFYQYSVVYAAVILLFYYLICNNFKLSLKVIKEYLFAGLSSFGAGLVNLLTLEALSYFGVIPRLFKTIGVNNWGDKWLTMLDAQISIYSSCYGIFPKVWFPLVSLLIPFMFAAVLLYKNGKCIETINFGLVILVSNVVLNILPMMNATYGYPGRMSFCIFLIIGLTYVAFFSIEHSEKAKVIIAYTFLSVLLINMIFSHFILEDRFVSNTLDETYTALFIDKLEEYEEESGNTISKIVVGYDADSHQTYDRVTFSGAQINERALSFAPVCMIQYVSGRTFEKLVMDTDTRERLFLENNWGEINLDEQVVFDGDTVYWCIF